MLRATHIHGHIPLVFLLMAASTASAQEFERAPDERGPSDPIGHLGNGMRTRTTARVNARFETTTTDRQADFDRVVTSARNGYLVQVTDRGGVLRMAGACLDALALVFHGPFQYYDQHGTLRSEGSYAHGVKTGTWQRYDESGLAMPDKEYDGLDREHEAVKLGLVSLSGGPDMTGPK